MYDKEAVKRFVKEYQEKQVNVTIENDNIDDFFSLNHDGLYDMEDNQGIDETIFLNELEAVVERVGTTKQQFIFYLLCQGNTLKQIGKQIYLSRERVRQLYNDLLDKICE